MKVAYWYNNQDIRLAEIPKPQPGPQEILVEVISCGICGSDLVEWYRLPRAPLVQGHEIGARINQTGSQVKNFQPGDRVFIAPKVPCLQCFYCQNGHYPQCTKITDRLPGGFAEYVLVPEIIVKNGVYLLPDSVSYDQSTFIEPLACVVRAQKLARVGKEDTVLVIGCGMSGLLQIKLARSKGCRVIAADINPTKLAFAARLGADVIDDATDIACGLLSKIGKKADVVLLCASADTAVEQAWNCVDKGGAIVLFTVPGPDKKVVVPINDFWMKEITILTSYYCGPPDIAEAMDLLSEGKIIVDDLITHRLSLNEIAKGFQLVAQGREAIKVIIKPRETSSNL